MLTAERTARIGAHRPHRGAPPASGRPARVVKEDGVLAPTGERTIEDQDVSSDRPHRMLRCNHGAQRRLTGLPRSCNRDDTGFSESHRG